jgi:hypothetical protein
VQGKSFAPGRRNRYGALFSTLQDVSGRNAEKKETNGERKTSGLDKKEGQRLLVETLL